MAEILNILFNPLPNAIMTLLTGLSLLYWLFTMLMGDGFDFGDGNVDIDFDGADIQDVDTDSDIHDDVEINKEPSFFSKAMEYINIGKAPMMVIVTLFKFIGWVITIASSLIFRLSEYGWMSVWILIPVLILSYFILHYVSIPVVKLYNKVGYTGEEALELLGRVGVMRSTIKDRNLGSAEFIINQDVIKLNVCSKDGSEIAYGEEVTIIDESIDKKYYLVQKNLTIHNF